MSYQLMTQFDPNSFLGERNFSSIYLFDYENQRILSDKIASVKTVVNRHDNTNLLSWDPEEDIISMPGLVVLKHIPTIQSSFGETEDDFSPFEFERDHEYNFVSSSEQHNQTRSNLQSRFDIYHSGITGANFVDETNQLPLNVVAGRTNHCQWLQAIQQKLEIILKNQDLYRRRKFQK